MANLFQIVQLLLKVFGLWEAFLDYMDASHSAALEERRQKREKALAELDRAKTDEEIWEAQEKVVDAKPNP